MPNYADQNLTPLVRWAIQCFCGSTVTPTFRPAINDMMQRIATCNDDLKKNCHIRQYTTVARGERVAYKHNKYDMFCMKCSSTTNKLIMSPIHLDKLICEDCFKQEKERK